jgi:hypothetical protein
METAIRSEARNQDLMAVMGGDRRCRRHHNLICLQWIPAEIRSRSAKTDNRPNQTPMEALTSTGVKIRATEAERTSQIHYPAFGTRDQGGSRRDVPQLPDRMHKEWEAERTPALRLLSMR